VTDDDLLEIGIASRLARKSVLHMFEALVQKGREGAI
jgi:hypothetical protein